LPASTPTRRPIGSRPLASFNHTHEEDISIVIAAILHYRFQCRGRSKSALSLQVSRFSKSHQQLPKPTVKKTFPHHGMSSERFFDDPKLRWIWPCLPCFGADEREGCRPKGCRSKRDILDFL
jgi:hypothetical protein